ncbi:MAG: alpha/beta fold hydrolase [Thermoplasmatota archaeon]
MREPPAWLTELFDPPRRDVQVGAWRQSVVDTGPGPSGKTVVLLHGNPTWSFLYRHLWEPLAAAGHRVIIPDHMGMGCSDQPTDPSYYTAERHASNLAAVLEALDVGKVTLLLHDWGGPIGMAWAVRNPERLERLVLANTVSFVPRRKKPLSLFHRVFASGAAYTIGTKVNVVGRVAMRFGTQSSLPPAVRKAYAWPLETTGGRVCAQRFVQLVPDGPDHPSVPLLQEVKDGMAGLAKVPVHVWWADKDPVFPPRFAEYWLRGLPHAQVEHVSQGGHFWQEDAAQPVLDRLLVAMA